LHAGFTLKPCGWLNSGRESGSVSGRDQQKGLLIRILEMQGQDNRVPLADRERVKTEAAVLRAKTEFLDVFIFKGQDEPDADS